MRVSAALDFQPDPRELTVSPVFLVNTKLHLGLTHVNHVPMATQCHRQPAHPLMRAFVYMGSARIMLRHCVQHVKPENIQALQSTPCAAQRELFHLYQRNVVSSTVIATMQGANLLEAITGVGEVLEDNSGV